MSKGMSRVTAVPRVPRGLVIAAEMASVLSDSIVLSVQSSMSMVRVAGIGEDMMSGRNVSRLGRRNDQKGSGTIC